MSKVSMSISRRLRPATRRFVHDERGSMLIFGLMILVLMLISGGMAVDIMRYEATRTKLQYTLDRAVLAAASLDQEKDPTVVVKDYFAKAGITGYNIDIDVDTGPTFRTVQATGSVEMPSIFLSMVGIDSITTPAIGTAEDRIQNVEISMVLDISGSMGNWSSAGGKSKMNLMKDAAIEFVGTMLKPQQKNLVSISIVPYNGKVNAGTTINNYFTLSGEHSSSNCVRFTEAQFKKVDLSPGEALTRLSHFDRDGGNTQSSFNSPHCQTSNYGAILPWSNNQLALTNHINSLNADGWTAIDLGMKWATMLLDPSTQSKLTAMNADNLVATDFVGRPAPYEDPETMKVIILMTDGANTNQYDLKDAYKHGMSNVWRWNDDGDIKYSYYLPNAGVYRRPNSNTNYSNPWGGNNATRLTYAQLWASHPVKYVARSIYDLNYGALGLPNHWNGNNAGSYNLTNADIEAANWSNKLNNAVTRYAGQSTGDDRLEFICDAAKAASPKRLVIFSIAFEAPAAGEKVLRYCASDDNYYYDVNGLEITEAFREIASVINKLRLTQ